MSEQATAYADIFLNPGGDRRLRAGHPWVYANEVRMDETVRGLDPGTVACVHRVDGKPLGIGTFNPHALIAFRLLSVDKDTAVDAGFVGGRMRRALALRERLYDRPFYRLIHGEADGLPGLVVDRYGEHVVVQAGTAGMERLLGEVLEALDAVLAPAAVVLRNDAPARRLEGLESEVRTAKGLIDGPVMVEEEGLRYFADLENGQKTGWFYDQSENRAFAAGLAEGGRVLDVYCHSGAFGLRAAAAGATAVLGIDSSEAALALAGRAAEENGLGSTATFRRGDVFAELEGLAGADERYRLVVADPPAFARSRKEVKPALKGYRKLAHLSTEVVESGGFLFIASCSHNVSADAFSEEVGRGVGRAGRTGRIVRAAGAAPDHPVHPHLPESAYLKSLVLELD